MDEYLNLFEPEPTSGCWLWTGWMANGYGVLRINGKMVRAHRLSFELHHGKIPPGEDVCHKCDTPTCVNPDHLFAGSRKINMQDCVAKNRIAKGSRHGRAKLTEDDVRFIINSNKKGVELATMFDVHPPMISRIRTRKNWRHVA